MKYLTIVLLLFGVMLSACTESVEINGTSKELRSKQTLCVGTLAFTLRTSDQGSTYTIFYYDTEGEMSRVTFDDSDDWKVEDGWPEINEKFKVTYESDGIYKMKRLDSNKDDKEECICPETLDTPETPIEVERNTQ